ncbi:hypothetical protein OIU77_012159 [Salix suchowensis]|uniref:Uncharacterized protein n=1 Tax=Salix suchowensis TaxID=1278906 RepID=A0ABQ9A3D3_9ROSI|nr:hypothetical protein OIU77_012159 [Salix suchowensis]
MMTAGEGKPAANSVLNQPLPSHSTGTQIWSCPTQEWAVCRARALVGVNWKADEEGEQWFLTELETT